MTTADYQIDDASFRDPSGFIFWHNGTVYRQINQRYAADFSQLHASGLYDNLVKRGLLLAHTEVDLPPPDPQQAHRIIQPQQLLFFSYPYEWCFSQLQDAAFATLRIQKLALQARMSLKDASAYNIQFVHGRPTLIDTLSFERYVEGQPWVAYRQFCQHFLAPLALMAGRDVRLGQLLRVHLDGVPLDLASTLLPWRTRFSFGLLSHIHSHARAQQKYADAAVSPPASGRQLGRTALLGIIDSLESTVKKLRWQPKGTEWVGYYAATNYTDAATAEKLALVGRLIAQVAPQTVWDLGANTGRYSRLASAAGAETVAFDIDPAAVEVNYRQVKAAGETNLLPLVLDLTNPSPALGWGNAERPSLLGRAHADLVLALALIHHLAIGNNVPLPLAADFFARLAPNLIIEFVPKSDSQVQRLLATREDIFDRYSQADFEAAFGRAFTITAKYPIAESDRVLYLMQRH